MNNMIAAATAAEGLEQVQMHKPDVIFNDIGIPQTGGYQFMREGEIYQRITAESPRRCPHRVHWCGRPNKCDQCRFSEASF
ncbi:MAG: hypothetical protein M3Q16_10475 [Pseudomonadota bacterium]|nr:hypothetical protein [Pseudomonadota bacterium]